MGRRGALPGVRAGASMPLQALCLLRENPRLGLSNVVGEVSAWCKAGAVWAGGGNAVKWCQGRAPCADTWVLIEVDLSATAVCRVSYRFDSTFVFAALYGTTVAKSVASWPTVTRAVSSRWWAV